MGVIAVSKSTPDAVSAELPTLERALQLQNTAAAAGLDWPEATEVWSKINEELAEAKAASEDITILGARIAARAAESTDAEPSETEAARSLLRDELGDLLFAVVDVCRMLEVNPEDALNEANDRFANCFRQVEAKLRDDSFMLGLETSASIRSLWKESKRIQRIRAASVLWKGASAVRTQGPNLDDLQSYAQA